MPFQNRPRIYRSTDAPATPEQGDIIYRVNNGRLEQYTGSAWGGITFANTNAQTATVAALAFSGTYASTNTTTSYFEVPGVAGVPSGAVTPTTGNVAIVFDTTNRRLFARTGGSWFATASMAVV